MPDVTKMTRQDMNDYSNVLSVVPGLENKPVSAQADPNIVLNQLLNEYPGLKRIHSPKDTMAVFASPERIKAATEASKSWSTTGQPGFLEYWPKDETGSEGFPHPTGGKGNVLEIYNDKLKDPEVLKPMIYGDLLHGMSADPIYAKLREDFKNNFSPSAKALILKRKGQDDFYSEDSTIDAFIRGALVPYKEGNWLSQDKKLYSDKQIEILKQIEDYLKTPDAGGANGNTTDINSTVE
jgi:hypothetical protein